MSTLSAEDNSQETVSEMIKPLPWASRLSSIPYLPGGGAQQIEQLRRLLTAIREKDGLLTAEFTRHDGKQTTLRKALLQFSSTGFIQPLGRDQVALTEDSLRWLETGRDQDLMAIFHRHTRFFGEMLHALAEEGPCTSRDLNNIAVDRYDLPWSTLDQTRRRMYWFQGMGAVEYRTSKLLTITERGRELLKPLIPGAPTGIPSSSIPAKLENPPTAILDLLNGLTLEGLLKRNPVLGYIPRGQGGTSAVDALHTIVNASAPSTTKADLLSFVRENFGVKESSFNAVLTTLTKAKLIHEVSLNVYEPTEAANAWLETADPLDLAYIIHANFLFVFEIIPLLDGYDRTADLARIATEYYGLPRVDQGGIRTRLNILKASGLITEKANWRYQATPLGEAVAMEYPLQQGNDESYINVKTPQTKQDNETVGSNTITEASQLGRDLVAAGTDSDNSIVLEQTTARAFQFLGFQAQHHGGSGKTDITMTLEDENLEVIRISVDTKSARSGNVLENAVSFDTLLEHKAQTNAEHIVLVGPSFETGRLKARAKQNGVTLITTGELAEHLLRHAKIPLSSHFYLGLVSGKSDDIKQLEAGRTSIDRKVSLLQQIISVLAKEARDPDEVTNGALTSDQIYLIARQEDTDSRPRPQDIEAILRLLQHPLVDSIRVRKTNRGLESYYLIDDPKLVQAKLQTLSVALVGLDEEQ